MALVTTPGGRVHSYEMSEEEQGVDLTCAEAQADEMEISMVTEVVEEAVISDTVQSRHDR